MQSVLLKRVLFLVILLATCTTGGKRIAKLLPGRGRAMIRRVGPFHGNLKPKVCYDLVGCFADPPPHLTLKRPPEHPNVIQTRFLLYTRSRRDAPDTFQYGGDFKSLLQPRLDATRPLKVVIHGYKGSGNDAGAVLLAQALLDVEETNVLVLDWTRGAATTYQVAVGNTELVGRQLGLVLLDIINLGTSPDKIHVIGFSLGAHIAGCASEVLKAKNLLLGRITGLDPASPFFRNHLLRDKSRKLDATDARLVDVIHTDGSEDFADGFGLLKPLGHIDFFPNGGREQPGCTDIKNSVVVSHLREDMLTREIACSHLKAWAYFLESVRRANDSCKFVAWPCSRGRASYTNGLCFPMESTMWSQEMGYRADRGSLGIYYLPTREEEPFCGEAVRAAVITSKDAPRTAGTLSLKIMQADGSTTSFKFRFSIKGNKQSTFYNIAAMKQQHLSDDRSTIKARASYQVNSGEDNEDTIRTRNSDLLFVDKIILEDRKGNRWESCASTPINVQGKEVLLHREQCSPL